MEKAVKKKSRRLKKTVRKTLGTLFLISAIVVAAIPVEGLQASDGQARAVTRTAPSVTTDSSSRIPQIDASTRIYLSGDRNFYFAYVPNKGGTKVAVLLRYNGGTLGDNSTLTIPPDVDAYAKFSQSMGTAGGYAAVGANGNFLFWKKTVKEPTGNTISDNEGNQVPEYRDIVTYEPCYLDKKEEWESLNINEFYYDITDPTGMVHPGVIPSESDLALTTNPDYQRIQKATVEYISNQYIIDPDQSGNWKYGGEVTAANPGSGVFAQEGGNIVNLVVGEGLLGIGDYAFYRCANLASIKLGNGLTVIGNGAFSDCGKLTRVDVEVNSAIDAIGDHAFYNCRTLKQFVVPTKVSKIGDSAFENCQEISIVDLCSGGQGNDNSLSELGRDVFKNCETLQNLTFPSGVETVYLSSFEGCRSLEYISTRNNTITFPEEEGVYTYEQFQTMLEGEPVNGAFYFEGYEGSPLHQMARENLFAFSYLAFLNGVYTKLDRYELTVEEIGGTATYEVNSSRHLIACRTDSGVESVTIPDRIGPHNINYIDSTTFQNHCFIKKVTIPPNVLEIAGEAFKGCHRLTDVIFESENVIIGSDAFKTQDNTSHEVGCGGVETVNGVPVAQLHFTGPISYSSGPFKYAMSENGKYNIKDQEPSYITYYSGWPDNLEIEYNPETQMSELVNFPSFSDLKSGYYNSDRFAYITPEQQQAGTEAMNSYPNLSNENQQDIVNAALSIVVPEGVQSIKPGLIREKELADIGYELEKEITVTSLQAVTYDSSVSDNEGVGTGTFAGCEYLKKITLLGETQTVSDYGFAGCSRLQEVTLPTTLKSMGIRPFKGCEKLTSINFQENSDYAYVNGMVFGPDSKGNSKSQLLELLESRNSGVVNASDLSGVTEIAKEAFADTGVSNVDLKGTTIARLPERVFANTEKLSVVRLPYTCGSIQSGAFDNSELEYIEIPVETTIISPDAFNVAKAHENVTFYCEPDSQAEEYAFTYGFATSEKPIERHYVITFWDWDEETGKDVIVETQEVEGGMDAVPPEPRGRSGYVFTNWFPAESIVAVSGNADVRAVYAPEDENLHKFKVTFKDYDGTELGTDMVDPGGTAESPRTVPEREGYIFIGWQPALSNITEDTVIWAQYKEKPEDEYVVRYIGWDDTVIYTTTVGYGEDAPSIVPPTVEGYTFVRWRPGITNITQDTDAYAQYEKIGGTTPGGDTPGGTDTPGGNTPGGDTPGGNTPGGNTPGGDTPGSNDVKTYTLTVRNGSGSGSYVAGSQPIIIANDPASGQEFSNWTIEPEDTKIASKAVAATVITMPEEDVVVTANYKAKTGTSTGSGTTGSGNSSNRPNNVHTLTGGTTVVIDKNGLSNTGVVSATVNGSSDNFTIKISESSTAAEAAVKALMAEYGDLNNIKYFPMDISLYDSTGQKKITDTTGLTISITLPLPDALTAYAGNNKIAGIVNDRLDKLSPKFTTISGVPCITFTAEHFSPYVIYVDTNNLSAEGAVIDSTPKTGDGIHPKWFLSMGLACVSIVLFMKKDRKTKGKVLVKA